MKQVIGRFAGRLFTVQCEDCGGHRMAYCLGSVLMLGAYAVFDAGRVAKHELAPPPLAVQTVEVLSADPLDTYRPASGLELPTKLGDDSAHDHREFDPDTSAIRLQHRRRR